MIIIVTGFGRCGSSLVMQMLHAGGVPCDGEYPAFESERGSVVLAGSALNIDGLDGHAVKVLDPHLGSIPRGPDYRVIWMRRNHAEQGKSQAKFLSTLTGMKLGREVARDFARSCGTDEPKLRAALVRAGCEAPHIQRMCFEDVLEFPEYTATIIAAHVGINEARVPDMRAVVRKRSPKCAPDLSMELSLIRERAQ